jgi:hypothetical protein
VIYTGYDRDRACAHCGERTAVLVLFRHLRDDSGGYAEPVPVCGRRACCEALAKRVAPAACLT